MEIIQPKKERKRNIESSAKQGLKWQKYISINNHFKYQWTECSNQKIQSGRLDKKAKPTLCCLQETHLRAKDTYRLNVRGSVSWQWTRQKSRSCNTYIGQNRL